MSQCIRCGCNYREPPGEQGDHDCPRCGLRPEQRAGYEWDKYTHRWVEKEDEG